MEPTTSPGCAACSGSAPTSRSAEPLDLASQLLAHLDARIAGAGGDLLGPQLELQPDLHEEIRRARPLHQGRAGLDVVRVLARIRERVGVHALAPDLAGQAGEHAERGDDLELLLARRREEREGSEDR